MINALRSYNNVHFRWVNLNTYAHGTPLESFSENGLLFLSKFVVSHTSDFLRYLSLFRFGGIHLDLDVVVQKNLDTLAPNFSGAQNELQIAVGAMGFQQDPIGHMILEYCLKLVLMDYSIFRTGRKTFMKFFNFITKEILR